MKFNINVYEQRDKLQELARKINEKTKVNTVNKVNKKKPQVAAKPKKSNVDKEPENIQSTKSVSHTPVYYRPFEASSVTAEIKKAAEKLRPKKKNIFN